MTEKGFIEHLGGLRGLAILLVLLYHLGNMHCPQGFLGVDVFLVLMGYFMLKHFACDADFRFRVRDFLPRRVARLYTPFLWVALATLAAAAILFPAPEMERTGRTGFSALLGFSNYFLDKTGTGYFAEGTRTNPFMHTWYFSIALQCSLLYAIVARCMSGTGRRARIAVLVLVFLASICLHPVLYMWNQNAEPGTRNALSRYYWLTPRLWEVAAGGLAWLLPRFKGQFLRSALTCGSLGLVIALSLVKMKFVEPAYVAVAGATLLIITQAPENAFRHLLANRFLLFTGKISYSLFLVHWGIIAFFIYRTGQEPSLTAACGIIALSYLLATGLWYVAERRREKPWVPAAAWAALVATCTAAINTGGFRNYLHTNVNNAIRGTRLSPGVACLDNDPLYADYPKSFIPAPSAFCGVGSNWLRMNYESGSIFRLGAPGTPSFVIMGDSHAQAMAGGLHELGVQHGLTGMYLHTYVMPIWNYRLIGPAYQYVDRDKTEQLVAWLAAHRELDTVVLTLWWADHFKAFYDWELKSHPTGESEALVKEGIRTFCAKLKESGKRVIILADNPNITRDATRDYIYGCLMRREQPDATQLSCTRAKYDETNSAVHQAFEHIRRDGLADVLYPSDCLFNGEGIFHAYRNGKLYMGDSHHLTPDGVLRVLDSVKGSLVPLLRTKHP